MQFTKHTLNGDIFVGTYIKYGEVYSAKLTLENGVPVSGLLIGPRFTQKFDPDRHTKIVKATKVALGGKLPSRCQKGLTLSYIDGDLYVISFGYSGSLLMVSNEYELNYDGRMLRDPKILNDDQCAVVDDWMDHYDAYLEALA